MEETPGYWYCHRCGTKMHPTLGCLCILPYRRRPLLPDLDYAKVWVKTGSKPEKPAFWPRPWLKKRIN